MNTHTGQIRTALALVIGAALIDRAFLHLLDITPAALIACVLVAVTLAAGQRPGAIIKLALMWWLWTAVFRCDHYRRWLDARSENFFTPIDLSTAGGEE